MRKAEHYSLGLDLKRKVKELANNIDTIQLGFDDKTLKENDAAFVQRCKLGTNEFRKNWDDELVDCYYPVVEISGWGKDEWDFNIQNSVNIYTKLLMLNAPDLYKVANQGQLINGLGVLIKFELVFDTRVTFNRVYRLSINANIVDGDLNPLDIKNNNYQAFQNDYLANQINLFDEHWKELSEGDFIIAIINWLLNE